MVSLQEYIESISIEDFRPQDGGGADGDLKVSPVLPTAVVAKGNLLAFSQDVSPKLRKAVAYCLLAAQHAADKELQDCEDEQDYTQRWLDVHNNVLTSLLWILEEKKELEHSSSDTNLDVRESLIPILALAFGGASAASLVVELLEGLQSEEHDEPWFKLFSRSTRKFSGHHTLFSTADHNGRVITITQAFVRFDVSDHNEQFLFFRNRNQRIRLSGASFRAAALDSHIIRAGALLEQKMLNVMGTAILGLPI